MASVSMCVNILRWLPVIFVFFLFIWSSYTYIVQMCFYMVTNTIERVIYMVVFFFLLFMCQWCFFKALFTDVAVVPFQFFLTSEEKELASQGKTECNEIIDSKGVKLRVQGRTVRGCVRYCEQCKCIKPDRAHHCSTCEKCVLKMDHHCPWINNCVCYSNYKFFFLFISYSFILCLYIAVTSCQYFIIFWTMNLSTEGYSRFHVLFLFFISIMFTISLLTLFSYHLYLVVNNRTTLGRSVLTILRTKNDFHGDILVMVLFLVDMPVMLSLITLILFHVDLIFKNRTTLESLRAPSFRSGPDKNAYNKGCKKNFIEVFGRSPLLWFIPVFTDMGDGVTYTARISPIPVGYRSMENSTLVTLGSAPKIETKSVPVQPSKTGLNTENASNSSSQREVIALKALNQAVQSQVTAERIKRFM